mgnify:CR=1 FL=1
MNQDPDQPNKAMVSPYQAGHAQRLLQLVQGWLDESDGYDEWAWPIIMQDIEENRLSDRPRFGVSTKG